MIDLAMTALWAVCATPAALAGYAGFFSWRARRRNARELCGHCGGPQYAAPGYEAPALVQGRVACAPCAARSRRRVGGALAVAGVLSGAAVLGTVTAAAVGTGGWALPVLVTLEYAGIFGGAVAWMKRRNRAARTALAAPSASGALPPAGA
jgi:predicted lipid-binding transport protein (Tim44 family)